ncbi:MAG: hypothetical protein ACW99A_20705 [Candidatus Kariarchaeaceae archaeon]|jgi:hypothetical protein
MENNISDLARSLQIHIGYTSTILQRREGNLDLGYLESLNDLDYNAAEIFYHGVNGLYRAIQTYRDPTTNFNDHNVERLHRDSIKDELLELYQNTVIEFIDILEGISVEQKNDEIKSPISGNETTIYDWFSTCVMHTIHHVGQSLRIHGMVLKRENNVTFDRKETPSYKLIE